MNARSLLHFFRVRCCRRAQWEIRRLAGMMLAEVRRVAPDLFKAAGPPCVTENICPEGEMSCGRLQGKNEEGNQD
jgi:thymidylate synthase (FAD)